MQLRWSINKVEIQRYIDIWRVSFQVSFYRNPNADKTLLTAENICSLDVK